MFLEGPRRLDEAGLEQLLSRAERAGPSEVGGLDLKDLHFVDPYGLLGLLSIGSSPAYREGQIWGLTVPGNPAVRSFLKRGSTETEHAGKGSRPSSR